MAQEKKQYEVVEEWRDLAEQVVRKYPQVFSNVDVDKIQCYKITNKDRKESKPKLWELSAVKMPIRVDCPYAWYYTVYANDWDVMDRKHKLLLVAEMLQGIGDEEGKVNSFDSKGFKIMQRTFQTIDYLDDPKVPDILSEDIEWENRDW